MFIEITKEQAEFLIDFMEAEFIKDGKGIACDKDLKDNEYVNGIREVLDKLKAEL